MPVKNLVSIWIISPGLFITKSRGNRFLRLTAAFWLRLDTFWLISPFFFKNRPTALGLVTDTPSVLIIAVMMYLDQVGFSFLISKMRVLICHDNFDSLNLCGRWDLSLRPIGPDCFNLVNHSLNASRSRPNRLAVRLWFWPCCRCQSIIFNFCWARLVSP